MGDNSFRRFGAGPVAIVGGTILVHKYLDPVGLATNKDVFDWTLGQEASLLADTQGANFALFVYFRDSYASAGRVAFMAAAAIFGVSVPGGRQIGYSSLVDLRNGEVVWFNFLNQAAGDLRTSEPAQVVINQLMRGVPL